MIGRRTRHGGWPYGQQPTAFVLNRASQQAKGLVGWWPTAGAPGASVLRDCGNRKLNAPFLGGVSNPIWATEPAMGGVLQYEGGDWINTPDFRIPFVTLTAWIKTTQAVSAYFHLLNRDNGSTARVWQFRVYNSGGHKLQFICWNSVGGFATATGTTVVNDGVLHHVAATYDGIAVKVYVDGFFDGSANLAGVAVSQSASIMVFGGAVGAAPGAKFVGLMGDVRVYDRALSDAEIWQLWAPQTRWGLYRPLLDSVVAKAPTVGTGSRTLATTGAGAS